MVLFGTFASIMVITPALAMTNVSLSPTTVTLDSGKTFTLTIIIDPQEIKNYTTKIELRYPVDLVKVSSFTFAPNWMPLIQPGYDSINNTEGVLIKTGGYAGGLSTKVTFGTVLFSVKKSGNGVITLHNGNSLSLDADNKNVITNASVKTTLAMFVPPQTPAPSIAPAPIKKLIPKTPVTTPTPVAPIIPPTEPTTETTPEETVPPFSELETLPQPTASSPTLSDRIYNIVTLGTQRIIVFVALIFAVCIGYLISFLSIWLRSKEK